LDAPRRADVNPCLEDAIISRGSHPSYYRGGSRRVVQGRERFGDQVRLPAEHFRSNFSRRD
jgi:hypothetical protein